MPNHSSGNINRLRSAAQSAADTVSDAMRDLPDSLQEVNREMAQKASDGLDALSGMANYCMEQGRDRMTNVERVIERRVRQQPLQALLIAFGIGAAFAFLARSRR